MITETKFGQSKVLVTKYCYTNITILCLLQNSELASLYKRYRLMNHDISDITYHEIHTNLPLLLHNLEIFFLFLRLTGFIKLTDQPIMTELTKHNRYQARYLLINHSFSILILIDFYLIF